MVPNNNNRDQNDKNKLNKKKVKHIFILRCSIFCYHQDATIAALQT